MGNYYNNYCASKLLQVSFFQSLIHIDSSRHDTQYWQLTLNTHLNRTMENSHGSFVTTHDILAKVIRRNSLSLEVGSNPRKANGIESGLAFVSQLRLEATKLERVLATLLHDPTTKRLVGRVALGDVAVAMDALQLFIQNKKRERQSAITKYNTQGRFNLPDIRQAVRSVVPSQQEAWRPSTGSQSH